MGCRPTEHGDQGAPTVAGWLVDETRARSPAAPDREQQERTDHQQSHLEPGVVRLGRARKDKQRGERDGEQREHHRVDTITGRGRNKCGPAWQCDKRQCDADHGR